MIEGPALDQFHGEEADAVLVLDGEQRDDVGVVERGNAARLAFEPCQMHGVGGHRGRKHLECDLAPEPEIARTVHLAHPAGTELLLDLVEA